MIMVFEDKSNLVDLLYFNICGDIITKCIPNNAGDEFRITLLKQNDGRPGMYIYKSNSEDADAPPKIMLSITQFSSEDDDDGDLIAINAPMVDESFTAVVVVHKSDVVAKLSRSFLGSGLSNEVMESGRYIFKTIQDSIHKIMDKVI